MCEPWLDCLMGLGEEFSSHLLKGTCYQYDLKFFFLLFFFCCTGLCCVGELFTAVRELFSRWSMQAPQLCYTGLAACLPFHLSPLPHPAPSMWDHSLQTKDWTCVPCIEKQILNQWTTREVPDSSLSRLINSPDQPWLQSGYNPATTLITWLQVSVSDFPVIKFSILYSLEGCHYMQLTSEDWGAMPHVLKGC